VAGLGLKKKDIQIIIVVTNNLSVPQAARLLLPVMPYFHNILKLTAKTSQEKKKTTPKSIWSLETALKSAVG